MKRGVHPHGNAKQKREQRGNEGKLDRGGKTLANERDHRLLELIGNAEIEMQRVPHEASELNDDGVVEPQGFAQLGAFRGGSFQPDHLIDRIAHEAE